MKKYYIFLSIFTILLLVFTGLTIFYYHDYYKITKEIYKLELNHAFTSLIPFGREGDETTAKERPDTSGLQAQADLSLALGIVFNVIACIALALFVVALVKTLKNRKTQQTIKE